MNIYIVWYEDDESKTESMVFITLYKDKAIAYAERSYYFTCKEYEIESQIQDSYIVGKEIKQP